MWLQMWLILKIIVNKNLAYWKTKYDKGSWDQFRNRNE